MPLPPRQYARELLAILAVALLIGWIVGEVWAMLERPAPIVIEGARR